VILKNWNFFPKIEKLVELTLEKNKIPQLFPIFCQKNDKICWGKKKKKTWHMCVCEWGLFFSMK